MEQTMSKHTTNDRGQVGVGTLIVFIAMVLVAAIASGVLINAAGLLQTKSAQASEESSEQVSNRIQAVNAVGQVNSSETGLSDVNITVSLSPSASEVDLSEATAQWVGPTGTYSLTHNSSSDGDGSFYVSQVKDEDDSSPVLNVRADRLSLDFNVSDFATQDLEAGASVEIRFTTRSGATTIIQLNVPRSVKGSSSVRL
ncbi:MAG: archaellin/type IV pilin N-terminal domain-containing protein [Halobacteriales archaeon]|nr:archaellin/type IV pilin N-terminal domain-containing protein [Halobacteriales archaeon]